MKIRTCAAAATAACMFMAAGNAMAFTEHVVSAHAGGSGTWSYDSHGSDSWLLTADYDQLVEFRVEETSRGTATFTVSQAGTADRWDYQDLRPNPGGAGDFDIGVVRFVVQGGKTAPVRLDVFFAENCDLGCANQGVWEIKAISAVPEPATYALLFAGLAAVRVAARRRSA